MSTAAVSSPSIFQEIQSFYQSRQADLKQLGSDLQSGDLSDAQQAYNALAALGQNGPFANSEPFSKSGTAQAFESIGQALQSGDLAGAQAAFAALTSSRNTSATSSQAAAVVSLTSTQPTAAADDASSIYQQLQAYRQQRQADVIQLGQDLQAGNLTAAQTDFNTLTTLGQSGPNKNGQPFEQADRAQDFQTIGQALQTGNLSLAQSAFASLTGKFSVQSQQAQGAISAYNSNSTSNPNAAEIVINLGSAANVAAPSASASATAPSIGPATPEVVINIGEGSNSSSPSSGASEIVINLGAASSASASSTSTTPELVINLGESSGAASGASSSAASLANPEEITINLGGNSGAQITLNDNVDGAQGQNGNSVEQVINFNPQNGNNELILNLLNASSTSSTQTSNNALSVSA
ncbi:MAG TPA: hypothetical protein VNU74_07350 [Terriglobales bacterium]|nr:hypothetical protein [Terriglobales bacterium]